MAFPPTSSGFVFSTSFPRFPEQTSLTSACRHEPQQKTHPDTDSYHLEGRSRKHVAVDLAQEGVVLVPLVPQTLPDPPRLQGLAVMSLLPAFLLWHLACFPDLQCVRGAIGAI